MQPLKRCGVSGTEVRSEQSSHASTEEQNRHWWCQRYQIFRGVPCGDPKCRGIATIPVPELDPLWCRC
jgi:hypothetical protein